MEAAIGKLSPANAQELAKTLTKDQGRDQVTKAAEGSDGVVEQEPRTPQDDVCRPRSSRS